MSVFGGPVGEVSRLIYNIFLETVPPLSCRYAWGIALWATACRWIRWKGRQLNHMPPLKTNMEPENGPFQKDMNHLPTIDFQLVCEFYLGCRGFFPASWLEKKSPRIHFTWTFWKGGWIFLKDCPEQKSGTVRFSISHRIHVWNLYLHLP